MVDLVGSSSSCSEEGIEVVMLEKEMKEEDGCEKLFGLERMVLTVLLVESDDSTRQIITALLRRCSYIVVAVSDGLKAWETLKGRTHSIDLILTEVELPSISGFTLLTLLTARNMCRDIPVIMMSSDHSVSVVFNCMLKGAADFLIKPIRKNELRNLWQHVWRRRTSTGGGACQNLAVEQHKVEPTFENEAAANKSSDYVISMQKNRECSEKGSDAQSSCTTPYLEAENAYIKNMQGMYHSAFNLSYTYNGKHEGLVELDKESVLLDSETEGRWKRFVLQVSLCKDAYNSSESRVEEDHGCANTMRRWDEDVRPESKREEDKIHVKPWSRAIDLIGTFDNHPKCSYGHSSSCNEGKDLLQLELSLNRCNNNSGSISNKHGSDEEKTLNHSNASAFSWYNNGSKPLEAHFPSLACNCTEPKEYRKQLANQVFECQWHGPPAFNSNIPPTTVVIHKSAGQVVEAATFPCSNHQLVFPAASLFTQISWSSKPAQVSPSHIISSHEYSPPEFHNNNKQQQQQQQPPPQDKNKLECEQLRPTTTCQSGNSCDTIQDGSSGVLGSIQREAALTKFRLKRKDRCFEKKVRYHNRKKLAEQRPRMKGQFVRHHLSDSEPSELTWDHLQ